MSNKRPETGAMQFGDDWPGIFIRGDNALHFALALHCVVEAIEQKRTPNVIEMSTLKGLVELLRSSAVGRDGFSEDEIQKLKNFAEVIDK